MPAGNAGPGNRAIDHPNPDLISVAAGTNTGSFAAGRLSVSAPVPALPTLQNMPYGTVNFGTPLFAGAIFTDTFVTATSVDAANFEGRGPWPGTSFTGHAAIIIRGSHECGLNEQSCPDEDRDFNMVSHQYAVCGTYTARVEAKDSWGNVAIGQRDVKAYIGVPVPATGTHACAIS